MSGPYAQAAGDYWAAGWRSVLPLPPKRKANPPDDYTGWKGTLVPSWPDVMAWVEQRPDGNICLRLPHGVVGLDVDNYEDKIGGQTLARKEAELGALPPTWRTTSRDDGISGIRLYRAPVLSNDETGVRSLAWPGGFGPGTETIHYGHRYVVAPPSIHPKTTKPYRWITPEGAVSLAPPRIADLPELPTAWVVGLTQGREAHTYQGAGMDDAEIQAWLEDHWDGAPCHPMTEVAEKMAAEMPDGAHESLRLLMRLVGMAAVGHDGLRDVLGGLRKQFIETVTPRRDDEDTAAQEWRRSLFGAVDNILGEMAKTGTPSRRIDPCDVLVSPADSSGDVAPAKDWLEQAHGSELPEWPGIDVVVSPAPETVEVPDHAVPAPGSVDEVSDPVDVETSLDSEPASEEHQPRELNEEELAAAYAAQREKKIAAAEYDLEIKHEAQQRMLARNAPPFRALGFGAFVNGPEPEPIVADMLYKDSLSRIFGAAGCGKSFLSLDLAFHVALGRSWAGKPVMQGRVAYVMAEGQRVNTVRAKAWQERHDVTEDELEGHFYAVPDALALTEAAIGPFVAWVKTENIALVILDTKNAMQVGEENSATDSGIMRRALDAIRKATDACVVLIDHTGKTDAEEARGSTAVKAAMDSEVKVVNDGQSPAKITVTVSRDKAAEAGTTWEFFLRMQPVAGHDKPGAVLVPMGEDVTLPVRERENELDWREAGGVPVPTELLHFEGPGAAAMPDLARYMACDASRVNDPQGVGRSRAEATTALAAAGHGRNTTWRAWSALIELGHIDRANGCRSDTGRHVWTH